MKLAFSTNAYTRHPLTDALRGIKAAGFEGVEVLADVPHAYPGDIDAPFTASVRRTLDQTGLAVSNINCNCTFGYWKDAPPEPYFEPSLISPNPKHREDRANLILKTLEFAQERVVADLSDWRGARRGDPGQHRLDRDPGVAGGG